MPRQRFVSSDANRLPRSGPLPKPKSPTEARVILKVESFVSPNLQRILVEAQEFTSLCPKSGQPDFVCVTIEYVPRKRCLESKALKYYLWSYRNTAAYCETIAAQIADDVARAISPKSLRVEVRQNVRGGIALAATAIR